MDFLAKHLKWIRLKSIRNATSKRRSLFRFVMWNGIWCLAYKYTSILIALSDWSSMHPQYVQNCIRMGDAWAQHCSQVVAWHACYIALLFQSGVWFFIHILSVYKTETYFLYARRGRIIAIAKGLFSFWLNCAIDSVNNFQLIVRTGRIGRLSFFRTLERWLPVYKQLPNLEFCNLKSLSHQ